MKTESLSTLKIHKLTQEQYQRELEAGRIDESALYLTPDEEIDLSQYATTEQVEVTYETKTDASAKLAEAKEYTNTQLANQIPTKVSELTNDKGYLTSFTETDPTVPAWAKASSKPTYTASEVGADAAGSASAVQTNLDAHTNNKSNPHEVTLSQLGVTATAEELNYVDGVTSNIQTQLNGKLGDYTIQIYNGTGGNPKPVRFASFNYSTCGSENGIAAKISLVSGHGNGTSYAFLEDAIIRVNYQGAVSVDNFKYYGAETGTYDEANRQYGDIFWLHDTTNKIVDFYVLMGQYARVYQTPWKRLTYSTGGTVTQHTSCTVYSSGDKVWGNNSDIALMSDINAAIATIPTPDVSGQINAHNTSENSHSDIRNSVNDHEARITAIESSVIGVLSGTEEPTSSIGEDGDIYLVTDTE